MTPIPVVVGPFEDLIAIGLCRVIEADPGLELVASESTLEAVEAALAQRDVAVLLLNLAGHADLHTVGALARAHPRTQIIVLADQPSDDDADRVVGLGVAACLAKSTQRRDVLTAIHLASRGMRVVAHGEANGALPAAEGSATTPDHPLTPREIDVLRLLRDGRTNAEIALALSVSVETVRTHTRRIYRKLGVSSRRALAPARAALRPFAGSLNRTPAPLRVTPSHFDPRRAPGVARGGNVGTGSPCAVPSP